MMRILLIGLLMGGMSSGFSTDANAIPMTYEITGEIYSIFNQGFFDTHVDLKDGDQFNGSLSYDNVIGLTSISFTFNNSSITTVYDEISSHNPYDLRYAGLDGVTVTPLLSGATVQSASHMYINWSDGDYLRESLYGTQGGIYLEFANLAGDYGWTSMNFTVVDQAPVPVPEPATMLLLGIGIIGSSCSRRLWVKSQSISKAS